MTPPLPIETSARPRDRAAMGLWQLVVAPGQHFDEINRFALLQQAQSAEDVVEDDPADYAETSEVLQSEPGLLPAAGRRRGPVWWRGCW